MIFQTLLIQTGNFEWTVDLHNKKPPNKACTGRGYAQKCEARFAKFGAIMFRSLAKSAPPVTQAVRRLKLSRRINDVQTKIHILGGGMSFRKTTVTPSPQSPACLPVNAYTDGGIEGGGYFVPAHAQSTPQGTPPALTPTVGRT